MKPILAAGCVVYRHRDDGSVEMLLAHRPRYDDWDFPKGKVDPGETELEAAIRETFEEVGAQGTIGAELAPSAYKVRGKDKSIRWWLMRFEHGEYQPNDEVDEVRWMLPDEALATLSYPDRQAVAVEAASKILPEDQIRPQKGD